MMNSLKAFLRKEPVLCAAAVLALVSCCFVPPSPQYLNYLDTHTLIMLYCLMTVVAGWRKAGVLEEAANRLLRRAANARQLCLSLVLLCFFTSMGITNDVALLTFVPLSILVLREAGLPGLTIYTVVLQTLAANLGSCLLPVGNPQNLYLYGLSGMSLPQFLLHMLPLWLLSLGLMLLTVLPIPKTPLSPKPDSHSLQPKAGIGYTLLFLLCLAAVAGWISSPVLLGILLAALLLCDRKALLQADFLLLVTFVCFFVFIGNLKAIPVLSQLLQGLIDGHELAAGILSSQIISNVPAAVLLSGFSQNIPVLLWSTNIGGLGTLIASLASIISYKAYQREVGEKSGEYLKVFTVMNLAGLALLPLAGWLRFR